MEGSDHGITWGGIPTFVWMDSGEQRIMSVRIASLQFKKWIYDTLNTKPMTPLRISVWWYHASQIYFTGIPSPRNSVRFCLGGHSVASVVAPQFPPQQHDIYIIADVSSRMPSLLPDVKMMNCAYKHFRYALCS